MITPPISKEFMKLMLQHGLVPGTASPSLGQGFNTGLATSEETRQALVDTVVKQYAPDDAAPSAPGK